MNQQLSVRPILYTDQTEEWLAILRAVGMRVLSRSPGWTLVEGGAGRLALHRLFEGVGEGQAGLGFETADLSAYVDEVRARAPEGLSVELVDADHGRAVKVVGRDGMGFYVDSVEEVAEAVDERPAQLDSVVVRALWVSTDVQAAADDLVALGCRKRLTQENGRTVDLDATAGRVLVHVADGGEVGAVLALDYDGDLDVAHAALLAAGIHHDVIDETHGRTLKVPMPGRDDLLWVAHEDDDPVGVVRHTDP
jgi:hypothetical protein